MHRRRKAVAAALLGVFGPFVVCSVYLLLSRWPVYWGGTVIDWVALTLAVGTGVVGWILLPLRTWQKVAAILLYVPAVGFLVALFALMFVCAVFGNCL